MPSLADVRLTRADLAEILAIPAASVDSLLTACGVPAVETGDETLVSAADIESLLRDSMIRLYRSVAVSEHPASPRREEPATTVDVPPEAPAPALDVSGETGLVTRSIAEFEASAPVEDDRPDLRIAPRYRPRKQLGGNFRQVKFTVLQLSTTGIRIRHDEPLRPGDEARLTFAVQKPARSFALTARVVWTSIAQRGDQPTVCVSGLTVIDREDQLHAAIDVLREARELEIETRSSRRPHGGAPAALTGMTDEDVAAIIRTLRKLNADPVEASRWYARARFSIADEQVRRAAPQRARDREEVLGIWEYLDRRIDVASIARVVAWIRQTRVAAAQ